MCRKSYTHLKNPINAAYICLLIRFCKFNKITSYFHLAIKVEDMFFPPTTVVKRSIPRRSVWQQPPCPSFPPGVFIHGGLRFLLGSVAVFGKEIMDELFHSNPARSVEDMHIDYIDLWMKKGKIKRERCYNMDPKPAKSSKIWKRSSLSKALFSV